MVSYPPPDYEHIDDEMIKMEVNLDDISGEWLGYVMEVLFDAGANDVFYIPIYMKKTDRESCFNCFVLEKIWIK